jgi:hypothetical protein
LIVNSIDRKIDSFSLNSSSPQQRKREEAKRDAEPPPTDARRQA